MSSSSSSPTTTTSSKSDPMDHPPSTLHHHQQQKSVMDPSEATTASASCADAASTHHVEEPAATTSYFSNKRPPFGNYDSHGFYFLEGYLVGEQDADVRVKSERSVNEPLVTRRDLVDHLNHFSSFWGEEDRTDEDDFDHYHLNGADIKESDRAVILHRGTNRLLGICKVGLNKRTGQGSMFVRIDPRIPSSIPLVPSHKYVPPPETSAGSLAELDGIDQVQIYRAVYAELEAAIRSHLNDVPEDKPVTIQVLARPHNRVALQEIRARGGYEHVRSWYEMRKDFKSQEDDAEAKWLSDMAPADLEFRPFNLERHARLLHAAQQEAFRDHSGHAEDFPFEEWTHCMVDGPEYRSDLFFILWDKNVENAEDFAAEVAEHFKLAKSTTAASNDNQEVTGQQMTVDDINKNNGIAGAVLAYDMQKTAPGMADIAIVFVRREYRRRGVAEYMLRSTFDTLQKSGRHEFVLLMVDGKSKTNAVALYERSGMYRNGEHLTFRRLIRGNPEDVVD